MVGSISAVSRVPSLILSEDSLVSLTARTKVDSLPGFTALLCVVTQCGGGALRDKERLYMKREREEKRALSGVRAQFPKQRLLIEPKRYTFPLRAYSTAMSVTCTTGALRAQRGERGILNEARSCCLAHRELAM